MYLPVLPVFESVVFISCCSLLDPFIICLFITTKMQKLTAEPIGCDGDKTSQSNGKPLVLLTAGLTDRHRINYDTPGS